MRGQRSDDAHECPTWRSSFHAVAARGRKNKTFSHSDQRRRYAKDKPIRDTRGRWPAAWGTAVDAQGPQRRGRQEKGKNKFLFAFLRRRLALSGSRNFFCRLSSPLAQRAGCVPSGSVRAWSGFGLARVQARFRGVSRAAFLPTSMQAGIGLPRRGGAGRGDAPAPAVDVLATSLASLGPKVDSRWHPRTALYARKEMGAVRSSSAATPGSGCKLARSATDHATNESLSQPCLRPKHAPRRLSAGLSLICVTVMPARCLCLRS